MPWDASPAREKVPTRRNSREEEDDDDSAQTGRSPSFFLLAPGARMAGIQILSPLSGPGAWDVGPARPERRGSLSVCPGRAWDDDAPGSQVTPEEEGDTHTERYGERGRGSEEGLPAERGMQLLMSQAVAEDANNKP